MKNYLEVINSIAWIILCGRTGKTRTVDEEDSLSHFLPINQDSSPKVSSHFYLSPELFIATTQTLNNFVYFFRQIVLHGPDRGLLQDQSRAAAADDCLSALIELHGRLSFGFECIPLDLSLYRFDGHQNGTPRIPLYLCPSGSRIVFGD